MNKDDVTLELDAETMRRFGYRVVDSIVEHFETLRDRPVLNVASRAETQELLGGDPPEEGEPLDALIREFEERVATRMSHVDHPRMFAFVPGAGTFVGAMGDALAAGYNIYGGTWLESSGPSQVELTVIDWFRRWLGLPEGAGGTLVSGGSVANLTGLIVAREQRLGDGWAEGVVYTSELAHSAVDRALRILGFRPDQLRKLPVDADFRLDVGRLAGAVTRDREAGRRPFCVVANAGATSTGTIDPLDEIAGLCSEQGLWLHVDAAYGGFAVLDERGRRWLAGIERADSVALDPHKWLYTPFEAGCILVRDMERLYDVFHILPDYLADVARARREVNFCDYGIQLSRSNRALKIWLAIRHFGLGRYRRIIGRTIDLAAHIQDRLERTPGFEITSPASLGVVTFRYVPPGGGASEDEIEALNRELLDRLWASGRAMATSTRVRGRYVLRACVINHNTRKADVDELVDRLTDLGSRVAAERTG